MQNICLVPLLAEFCWHLAGSDGFEFAENVFDIKRALASNRDITLVPSGFSTFGTGGRVDWSRRKCFLKLIISHAKGEKKTINLLPVVWLHELGSWSWFTGKVRRRAGLLCSAKLTLNVASLLAVVPLPALHAKIVERLRVKLRAPIGEIAFGYNPLLFWLPKRGPQPLGVGGKGIDVKGDKDVKMVKVELKGSFDETFKASKDDWNEGEGGGGLGGVLDGGLEQGDSIMPIDTLRFVSTLHCESQKSFRTRFARPSLHSQPSYSSQLPRIIHTGGLLRTRSGILSWNKEFIAQQSVALQNAA